MSNNNVLLIYPDIKSLMPRMPHSLLPIAGYLEKKGVKVKIFDAQIDDYKTINPNKYDFIGLTTLTGPQIKSALEIAKHIRSKDSDIPLVWGGIHATITPEETAKNEYVDIVVRGEGEETAYQLTKTLNKNKPLKTVKGITFKDKEKIINTPDRELINLDKLPLTPYHLIKKNEYSHIKRKPSIVYLHISRGCPHNCGFCSTKGVYNNKWRAMSKERSLEEIEHIVKTFKPDLIQSSEDNSFVNKKRMEEICNEIIKRGLDINWTGSSRFNYAAYYDDSFIKLIKKSGLKELSFGGESGSPRILKLINKGITIQQMKDTVKKLHKNEIKMGVNFMAGFPGETIEDIKKTFKIIDELTLLSPNISIPGISIFTPFPGTPLYPIILKQGFKPPKSLEEWGNYTYNDIENLHWVKGKTKALLKTISMLTRFQFNTKEYTSPGYSRYKIHIELAYWMLSKLAKFRWKNKFFNFPIEWRALEQAAKLLGITER